MREERKNFTISNGLNWQYFFVCEGQGSYCVKIISVSQPLYFPHKKINAQRQKVNVSSAYCLLFVSPK